MRNLKDIKLEIDEDVVHKANKTLPGVLKEMDVPILVYYSAFAEINSESPVGEASRQMHSEVRSRMAAKLTGGDDSKRGKWRPSFKSKSL